MTRAHKTFLIWYNVQFILYDIISGPRQPWYWPSSPWTFRPQCEISWWRHQMETFSAVLALCAGNSPGPVNSPHKSKWRGALLFSLIYAWINGWINNREPGDLRHHRGHYDVIVMFKTFCVAEKNTPTGHHTTKKGCVKFTPILGLACCSTDALTILSYT